MKLSATILIAAALVAGFFAAAQMHNGMDKPDDAIPDSIALPFGETSKSHITGIYKLEEYPVGAEIKYLERPESADTGYVDSIEIAGTDDIFLSYTEIYCAGNCLLQ